MSVFPDTNTIFGANEKSRKIHRGAGKPPDSPLSTFLRKFYVEEKIGCKFPVIVALKIAARNCFHHNTILDAFDGPHLYNQSIAKQEVDHSLRVLEEAITFWTIQNGAL